MDSVAQLLYTISTALQLPVMAALLLFLGWAALQVGGLLREAVDQRACRRAARTAIGEMKNRGAQDLQPLERLKNLQGPAAALVRAAQELKGDPLVLGKILDDTHLRLNDRVSRTNLGIRLGPMFGLMGTLIPMGPALTGLAGGDVQVLSKNLVVAFSTTVLGLLIGGICYVLQTVRKRQYTQDLSDLDFLHDILIARNQGEEPCQAA